jgi:hypothetical protein
MKEGKMSLLLLSALFFLCVTASQAGAQPFVLGKVVDTKTPIPGGSGNFTGFPYSYEPPYMVSGSNVAFQAGGESGQYGIYLFNGTTLTAVADYNTPIPGGSGNFTRILSVYPAMSDGKVVFHAGDWNGEGIYLFDGTILSKVADTNTPIPSGGGNFTDFADFYSPVISGNNIAFIADGNGDGGVYFFGVYLFNGNNLTKVADNTTPVPEGSGNFNSFSSLAISGDNIAFQGGGDAGQHGIYLFDGSTLRKVADTNTPVPGGSENFFSFSGHQAISGSNVAFEGGSFGQGGIYLFNGTTLTKVADHNTPVPGGSGNFTSFSDPVISGNNVAFWGNGIYLFDGATLRAVADTNTPIPGGSGNFSFDLFDPVISNGNVAFHAGGGAEGIYLFNGTALSKVADTNTLVPGGSGNFTGFFDPVIDDGKVAFLGSWGTGQGGIYLAIPQARPGDFDGDRKTDILWQHTDGTLAIWFMDGTTVTPESAGFAVVPSAWQIKDVADFDGDSKADILWQHTDGTLAIWFMNGSTILPTSTGIAVVPSAWQIKGIADFDGDSRADILWQHTDGTLAIWFMNGSTILPTSTGIAVVPSAWQIKNVGDFDGDSKADILWQNTDGTLAIWFMNGTTVLPASTGIAVVPSAWQIKGIGDFDGDTKADILWQNTDGTVAIWFMDGTTVLPASACVAVVPSAWQIINK